MNQASEINNYIKDNRTEVTKENITRKILKSKDESPMLPFGYPAMLILSYFPFIFKPIMEKQLIKYGMD